MKPFIRQNSIKQRSHYLRTNLANGCSESIAIKHRCSEFRAVPPGAQKLSVAPGGGAWWGLSRCCWSAGYFSNSLLQNRHWGYFCFVPFFVKAKILFRFFLVTENRYSCRPFVKSKWHKVSFQKVGDTCINISNRDVSLSSFSGWFELGSPWIIVLYMFLHDIMEII